MNTIHNGLAALSTINKFIPGMQFRTIGELMKDVNSDGQFFIDRTVELSARIANMPISYQQDGKGVEAIAYLRYFYGEYTCYITEKDKEDDGTYQAFGVARMPQSEFELGYICIDEFLSLPVELDLHFTPKALKDIPELASYIRHMTTGD